MTNPDLSGIHPLALTYREQVAGVPGHALTIRERYKTGKYRSYAESQGKDFLAFVIESFGGLGTDALMLLYFKASGAWSSVVVLVPNPRLASLGRTA